MSMLAEPRSRQKWSDDPRNTRWASDKSKFGYQMLEKMGWSEGSGLGQTLQGATSHVKIKKKKNGHGIGMKSSHDDDWIAHQDSFNALLSQLNSGDPANTTEKKIQSLEDRVRVTRTKIMYSRFVKSKDLSKATSNDLACIFGQRSKSAPATPQRSDDEEENLSDGSTVSCPTQKKTTEHGFTTISSGVSVADYFAKKMAALKQGKTLSTEKSETEEITAKSEGKSSEKKKNQKKVLFDDVVAVSDESGNEDSDESVEKKKKKKKKHKKANSDVIEISEDEANVVTVDKKKKKKHKKSVEDVDDDVVETDGATKVEVKKKKKRKKENKVADDDHVDVVICEKKEYSRDRVENEDDVTMETLEATQSPKKKNKKKKHESDETNDDDDGTTTVTATSKKSKKKKRKHEQQLDDCDETTNNSSGEERKKKRKRRHQSDGEDEKD